MTGPPRRAWQTGVLLCCAPLWMSAAQGEVQSPVVKIFQEHIADYLKLRESVNPKVPALKPTASPEAIKQHERALAREICDARRNAKAGDIFTPAIAVEFRRLIAEAMRGAAAERVRTSIERSEPVRIPVRVNEVYPGDVPLPSTPPSLLLNLPPLPAQLDYRVIGHDLVLRDTGANLIVDYIANAVP